MMMMTMKLFVFSSDDDDDDDGLLTAVPSRLRSMLLRNLWRCVPRCCMDWNEELLPQGPL
jgi:hypothetical protein